MDVMYSIQPQWVEKIINGKKTVEVRKTRPKLKPPFKGLIYCTKLQGLQTLLYRGNQAIIGDYRNAFVGDDDGYIHWQDGCGKVVGEFVCDKIIDMPYIKISGKYIGVETFVMDDETDWRAVEIEKATCLTQSDLLTYGQGKDLYGIHISDLKIYDRPKELCEFGRCIEAPLHENCNDCCFSGTDCVGCGVYKPLKRPPQSWGYCEEI